MTQITAKKEIVFSGKDGNFYIISLEIENGIEYNEEDIGYIKRVFNEGIGDKGGIAKDGSYIYWKIRKK